MNRAKRPNADYFNSDLHLHMFNICNTTEGTNYIYLYDERDSGKAGNTVCSMRWHYHVSYLTALLSSGRQTPSMIIKCMDNCVGQNKSQVTMMFDCLLSLILYERVANFFLLPGHSHMRADQLVSLSKRALNKKDLFIPSQIADAMNTDKGMNALVLKEGDFYEWETLLKKYFKPAPAGYTQNYCFEISGGSMLYKKTWDTDDTNLETHTYTAHVDSTRKALLHDLFNLPSNATLTEILGENFVCHVSLESH